MADFCNQCAEYLGFRPGDMAGISTPADTEAKLYAMVLCEECGWTQVDHTGKCVSAQCWCNGHKRGRVDHENGHRLAQESKP